MRKPLVSFFFGNQHHQISIPRKTPIIKIAQAGALFFVIVLVVFASQVLLLFCQAIETDIKDRDHFFTPGTDEKITPDLQDIDVFLRQSFHTHRTKTTPTPTNIDNLFTHTERRQHQHQHQQHQALHLRQDDRA